MTISDKILLAQTIVAGLAFFAAFAAAYLAWKIGQRQNEINQKALDIQNFVETFVMPQQVFLEDENGKRTPLNWNLIIKNASSYPIYLLGYTLNGFEKDLGYQVLPASLDAWYGINVPPDIQQKGILSLVLNFEDYLGRKYISKHSSIFTGASWDVTSQKSKLI